MVDYLGETKQNITNLNLQYLDISSKLTILQNNHLIVQLEYQIKLIEDMDKEIKQLKLKIVELEKERNEKTDTQI